MARPTYTARGIVLKKTKLSESDLIVTLLTENGCKSKGVAKGARKPGASLSARLELFNTVDIHCIEGRGLDTIKEARIVSARTRIPDDLEKAACAAAVSEVLDKLTQPDLAHTNLFDMCEVAFSSLDSAGNGEILNVCAAAILKIYGFAGIAPRLSECAVCGNSVRTNGIPRTAFSVDNGGVVCSSCAAANDCTYVDTAMVELGNALYRAKFSNIINTPVDIELSKRLLSMCAEWSKFHIGSKIKSLGLICDVYN